tara:strand:- start:696 stop:1418 length:723 start_codon:yes stop_codon:yes gene_type:complete
MKLLCITPTYGRSEELLQNSLACFYSQTYTNAVQVYVDDTFYGEKIRGDGFVFIQTGDRARSLSAKHDLAVLYGEQEFGSVDGIVIWDDDDIYLPNHLENIANTLQEGDFYSYSSEVYIDSNTSKPRIEKTDNCRFHGNYGFSKTLYNKAKWGHTLRMDFDLQMIHRLKTNGTGRDRSNLGSPTYVYRWSGSDAHHCSGVSTGPDDQEWYFKTPIKRDGPIKDLKAKYDINTLAFKDCLK